MRAGLITIWMIFAASWSAYGDTFIQINDETDENLSQGVYYLKDRANKFSIDQIVRKKKWKNSFKGSLSAELYKTTSWLKINVENLGDKGTFYIEFSPVFLEEITLYDKNGITLDQRGSMIEPQINYAFPYLSFSVPSGKHTFFASIKSRSGGFNAKIFSNHQYNSKKHVDTILLGVVLGSILSLICYHAFLFAKYRGNVYLTYISFLAASGIFTLSYTSYHHLILPIRVFNIELGFWASALASPMVLFAIYFFSERALPLKEKLGEYHKLLYILPASSLFIFLGILFTNSPKMLILVRLSALIHMLGLPALGVFLFLKDRGDLKSLWYSISWVPLTLGSIFIVLSLSGALSPNTFLAWSVSLGSLLQCMFFAFVMGQNLEKANLEKLKEKEKRIEYMHILENNLSRLKQRDQVVSSFVSPSILQEMEAGKNPLSYQAETIQQCVVFVDMRDYTQFSESNNSYDSFEILNESFMQINDSVFSNNGEVNKIIGDAVMATFHSAEDCLKSVVDLRVRLCDINRKRITSLKHPIHFGTGIDFGPVLSGNFGSIHKLDRTVVGDTVNTASRIESVNKEFMTDVLCSREFVDLHNDYPYMRPAGYTKLKGKSRKVLVYEIFGHHSELVREWKASTTPILRKVIQLELDGHYAEAISLMEELVAKCPAHSYIESEIMDPTLNVIVKAIKNKIAA